MAVPDATPPELDLRDLTALQGGCFDAALAYGGPLSYIFADAERCFAEMLRVTRRGGDPGIAVLREPATYQIEPFRRRRTSTRPPMPATV